jgi:hypothetical protein
LVGRLFASFFAAAMVAAAFAYYNYKFAEFKFIDFSKWTLYEKREIFKPTSEKYLVIIYNSRDESSFERLEKIDSETPILLLDYYQTLNNPIDNNTTVVKSGTNTMLKIIQRFNIYELPSIFFIKRERGELYKQNSDIYKLDQFQ